MAVTDSGISSFIEPEEPFSQCKETELEACLTCSRMDGEAYVPEKEETKK